MLDMLSWRFERPLTGNAAPSNVHGYQSSFEKVALRTGASKTVVAVASSRSTGAGCPSHFFMQDATVIHRPILTLNEEFEMSDRKPTRRQFVTAASAASLAVATSTTLPVYGKTVSKGGKLAVLGGEPVRKKNKGWPRWPYRDENVMKSIEETTKNGIWCRIQDQKGGTVVRLKRSLRN